MNKLKTPCVMLYFYPRSPCGERRGWTLNINGPMKFLSTLSLRRATKTEKRKLKTLHYFYPRSPCGERRQGLSEKLGTVLISIHALLAESDL